MGNLKQYLNRPVSELIEIDSPNLSTAVKERHRIYAGMLFSLTCAYFNWRKYGSFASYPLSPKADEVSLFSRDYFGHNIAAIAVDRRGKILDFEFNHNQVFNSSVEHAESRLVRRVFSLTQVHDSWESSEKRFKKYGNLLSDVTVYTTLESCSQCTGIMTLGDVKEVVYLQDDPGMYHIGKILKNLTNGQGYIEAPLPISGSDIDFQPYTILNENFSIFVKNQSEEIGKPFVIYPDKTARYSDSITSFLATEAAFEGFKEGDASFQSILLGHPDYSPESDALTNFEALQEAIDFLSYATTAGKRGTPHRM